MSNLNKVILIIDLHSILHGVKHAVGGTAKLSHGDQSTFVIYGFLFKLRHILQNVQHDIVVFACDSKKSLRKKLFSGYKIRPPKTQEMESLDRLAHPQFDIIKDHVLPTIGYRNIFEVDGLEADDIIAQIVLHDYPAHRKIVSTTDEDLYQLLSVNTWIFKHSLMKIYSYDDFVAEYSISPDLWKRVKAYGGCTSDTVPGIFVYDAKGNIKSKKIGKGTALSFLHGKLKPDSDTYKAFTHPKNREILNRNKKLVILPFEGTPHFRIVKNELSVEGLIAVSREYGFNSILQDLDSFRYFMKLK